MTLKLNYSLVAYLEATIDFRYQEFKNSACEVHTGDLQQIAEQWVNYKTSKENWKLTVLMNGEVIDEAETKPPHWGARPGSYGSYWVDEANPDYEDLIAGKAAWDTVSATLLEKENETIRQREETAKRVAYEARLKQEAAFRKNEEAKELAELARLQEKYNKNSNKDKES